MTKHSRSKPLHVLNVQLFKHRRPCTLACTTPVAVLLLSPYLSQFMIQLHLLIQPQEVRFNTDLAAVMGELDGSTKAEFVRGHAYSGKCCTVTDMSCA